MATELSKIVIPDEIISNKIYLIRGVKVMLDKDLADLYGVSTGNLNKSVKRNIKRFPDDFMFQLEKEEFDILIFHFGRSSWGGNRSFPYAFTEQGVAMLSSILNSEKAIEVNIQIVRAFVYMRQYALSHKDLTAKLLELENKYDQQFKDVYDAINFLLQQDNQAKAQKQRKKIGYKNS